jgi:6-pyruvoyltetrahydropterin/6-carboxytetrahydropterin synthase
MNTYTVSKTFSFCYGHRLLNDPGRCGHLHGHTARATFVMEGCKLDECGMVVHFDRLKETLGSWIDGHLDHWLLLAHDDPLAGILSQAGERLFLMQVNPTAENIARILFDKAREFGLPILRVEVWESESSKATYGGRT